MGSRRNFSSLPETKVEEMSFVAVRGPIIYEDPQSSIEEIWQREWRETFGESAEMRSLWPGVWESLWAEAENTWSELKKKCGKTLQGWSDLKKKCSKDEEDELNNSFM